MHSFHAKQGSVFHANGDFSGDIIIVTPNGRTTEIPAADIVEFAAQIVRQRKTDRIGEASDDEILDGRV